MFFLYCTKYLYKRTAMYTIPISELRNNLPEFLKKVERGEKIIVTSHGKEIAMLVPIENKIVQARERLQALRSKAKIGDVVSPTGAEWKAQE